MQDTRRFRQERAVNIVDTARGSSSSDESYYVDGISVATDDTHVRKKAKKTTFSTKWSVTRMSSLSDCGAAAGLSRGFSTEDSGTQARGACEVSQQKVWVNSHMETEWRFVRLHFGVELSIPHTNKRHGFRFQQKKILIQIFLLEFTMFFTSW